MLHQQKMKRIMVAAHMIGLGMVDYIVNIIIMVTDIKPLSPFTGMKLEKRYNSRLKTIFLPWSNLQTVQE